MPELVGIVRAAVRRHCRRYNCLPHERQDLEQDGIIAALAASSSYDPSGAASYPTWIGRRVQGQLIDSTRKLRCHGMTHLPAKLASVPTLHLPTGEANQGNPESEDASEGVDELEDCLTPSPETTVEIQQAMQTLDEALSPDDRELLLKYYGFEGIPLTLEEIAQERGVSKVAVFHRLQRLLRRCRGILEGSNSHVLH